MRSRRGVASPPPVPRAPALSPAPALHPGLRDIDPLTSLFWAPRTVSVLACGAHLVLGTARARPAG